MIFIKDINNIIYNASEFISFAVLNDGDKYTVVAKAIPYISNIDDVELGIYSTKKQAEDALESLINHLETNRSFKMPKERCWNVKYECCLKG